MVGYEAMLKFVKNIFYAKGQRFDEDYTTMWIREITNTGAGLIDLQDAEIEIIRENIPLRVSDVCDCIREKMSQNRPKIAYKPKDCKYCNGLGWVEALKFETNGKYTGYTAALNCCCGNKPQPKTMTMKEDISNHHRTEAKDGYYLCFPNVVEKFEYLDKVYANDNWDIRRG